VPAAPVVPTAMRVSCVSSLIVLVVEALANRRNPGASYRPFLAREKFGAI